MTDDALRTLLADRIASVRGRIAAACARAGREPTEVTLVAVTKTVSARVAGLLPELGVPNLGESRPQELWRKAQALEHVPIRWHLIGHLQRNKVERTLPLVHMIHGIDSLRLAQAIAEEGTRCGRHPDTLFQMNASHEDQKHGFAFDELLSFRDDLARLPLNVVGLMGMAAFGDDPEAARPTFSGLRHFRDRLQREWNSDGFRIRQLSMGMSGDFEVAVEEGATLVRIGTSLFEGLEAE